MTVKNKFKIRPSRLIQMKKSGDPIVMLTAYDFMTAKLLNEMEVEVVLVGDSLGNVFSGYESTLPVTMDQMVYHTQAVSRGISHSLIVADMPFLSYQVSDVDARKNAGRLIQEGGAHSVKMEVGPQQLDCVKSVIDMGIPVMGHIGFTPQFIHQIGGFRVQGRDDHQKEELVKLAQSLEKIGCFSILIEMVEASVSQQILESISVPLIGIGAGQCDGQVIVTQDLLGMNDQQVPSFVKQYAHLRQTMKEALGQFCSDVKHREFPSTNYQF